MGSQSDDSPGSRKKQSAKRHRSSRHRRKNHEQPQGISVQRIDNDVFELVFPRKVRMFSDDIEEVYNMLAHEEWDLAVDELLWLLRECRELLEAHQLLGRIALFQGKLELARAHLGYAYELGLNATGKNFTGRLPFARPSNRPLLQATYDLVQCLIQLDEHDLAHSVAQQLLKWDPSDPLHVRDVCSPA